MKKPYEWLGCDTIDIINMFYPVPKSNTITDFKKQGGNTMRKSDIRDTDIVTIRNGNDMKWCNFYRQLDADEYTLKDVTEPDFDIVKVVRPEQVLWEEEQSTEMTVAELEEKLGIKNLKIVK